VDKSAKPKVKDPKRFNRVVALRPIQPPLDGTSNLFDNHPVDVCVCVVTRAANQAVPHISPPFYWGV
jgi:hypothetical protein